MSLDDIIKVNVGNPPSDDGHLGERHPLTFEVYRTIAFERGVMEQCIGFGDAKFDWRGQFIGFNAAASPGMLNVGVWLYMVPVAYRDQVEHAAMYTIWDRFLYRKIESTTLGAYIDELREWISTHVAPTDDLRSLRDRFAAALAEVVVRAGYDRRQISRDEAARMMDEILYGYSSSRSSDKK